MENTSLINKKSKGKQISTEFNGDESKITGDKTIANLMVLTISL